MSRRQEGRTRRSIGPRPLAIGRRVNDISTVVAGVFLRFDDPEVIVAFHLRSLAYALMAISLAAPLAAAQNMTIRADLTDAPRGLIRGTLSIPVKPGPLTLVYPQWIPGDHSPTGPIADLAGLKFTAAAKTIAWRRDLTDMYAVHLDIPQGVTSLDGQPGVSCADQRRLRSIRPPPVNSSLLELEPHHAIPAGQRRREDHGRSLDRPARGLELWLFDGDRRPRRPATARFISNRCHWKCSSTSRCLRPGISSSSI